MKTLLTFLLIIISVTAYSKANITLLETAKIGSTIIKSNNSENQFSGTGLSAAYFSGVFASAKQKDKNITMSEFVEYLKKSTINGKTNFSKLNKLILKNKDNK